MVAMPTLEARAVFFLRLVFSFPVDSIGATGALTEVVRGESVGAGGELFVGVLVILCRDSVGGVDVFLKAPVEGVAPLNFTTADGGSLFARFLWTRNMVMLRWTKRTYIPLYKYIY